MTALQLKLVIETAENGSISAASKKLNVSQPNASSSIKKLEDELGYSLFNRSDGGITLTEQGRLFVVHARSLLEEDLAIRSLKNFDSVTRLRVGIINLTAASDAFLRFCHDCRDSLAEDCTCINVSQETGLKLLREQELDIVVSVQLQEMLPISEIICMKNRLTLTKHMELDACVRVRKDHPLLLDGSLDGSLEGFQKLSSYPYAEYMHFENMFELFNRSSQVPFGYTYRIFSDERDTRLRIIQQTDAYTIGVRLSKERMEKYGLVSIPLNAKATLVSFVRKGEEKLTAVSRYLEYLNEEASKLTDI